MPLTRILTLSLLLLVASGIPLVTAQQKLKQPEAVRTNTIFYRERGDKEYLLFGHYETRESADRVFEHLDLNGYQVKLEVTNTPIPKLEPITRKPTSMKLDPAETVTLEKATEVFQTMAKQTDIAYRFPTDGCYARAHLMVEQMGRMGLKPRKVWAVANGNELFAKTKNHPNGYVTWGYHVAPVLRVRLMGDEQWWYVIDPSLFTTPVTLTRWMQSQMRKEDGHQPFLTITKPGQPPKWVDNKLRGGSGYWPGNDPKEGVHTHAVLTMKKYKPFEGKAPPRKFSALWPTEIGRVTPKSE